MLNNNIGCFEISRAEHIVTHTIVLNNNIGCFEMLFNLTTLYLYVVKQQHRMF